MALIRRLVPEVSYTTIGNFRVKQEIDTFNIGRRKLTYYGKNEKYVELTKKTYVLSNVVGKIGKTASKANFVSSNGNDKVVRIMNNPNSKQSKEEFIKEFCLFVNAAGWSVLWKRYVSYGVFDTLEIINLDPDVTNFRKDGSVDTEYEGNLEHIEARDIIVFYDTVREEDNRGYSRIKPLRAQIDNILTAQIALGIQIENSGTTIVSPKATTGGAGVVDEGLNAITIPDIQLPSVSGNPIRTQKDVIEEKLNSRGIENRIIVAAKGLDAVNLSAKLNSMDFAAKIESSILAVCDAFNVNVELTPYGKNATYENKDVAELSLLENEAMPIINSLIRSLNQDLGGKAVATFSHIGAMSVVEKRIQEANGTFIDQYITLLDKNLISEEELKEKLKSKNLING